MRLAAPSVTRTSLDKYMSDLLVKKSPKASRASKTALDALLTELSQAPQNNDGFPSPYDREYQTKHQNPFADSRFDEVPVKEAAVNLQTGMVDGHERHLPPRDKNLRSETTKTEMKNEERKDSETYKLTATDRNYDFLSDKNGRIAKKVASNRLFKQYVTAANVKVDSDSLIVNIPRGKVAHEELSLGKIAEMEKQISNTLRVRAKFAHMILSSGFDGVAIECLLV